jgi:hypothetical protein
VSLCESASSEVLRCELRFEASPASSRASRSSGDPLRIVVLRLVRLSVAWWSPTRVRGVRAGSPPRTSAATAASKSVERKQFKPRVGSSVVFQPYPLNCPPCGAERQFGPEVPPIKGLHATVRVSGYQDLDSGSWEKFWSSSGDPLRKWFFGWFACPLPGGVRPVFVSSAAVFKGLAGSRRRYGNPGASGQQSRDLGLFRGGLPGVLAGIPFASGSSAGTPVCCLAESDPCPSGRPSLKGTCRPVGNVHRGEKKELREEGRSTVNRGKQ